MGIDRGRLCGWLLIVSILISIFSSLFVPQMKYISGALILTCAAIFIPDLNSSQMKQVGLLIGVGLSGLLFGFFLTGDTTFFFKALQANQTVISMLLSVGFLKLFLTNTLDGDDDLPKGKASLIKTLLGTHILGSVINMSSVVIIGDRLSLKQPLNTLQGLVLLRAFAICAVWSPFFATMGLTLTSAPGAKISTLLVYTLPVALFAIICTIIAIRMNPDAEISAGYPMTLSTLWMPLLLACTIMITHSYLPEINILTIVSISSLIFASVWLFCKK
jgi:hypothetical protein